MDEQGCSVAWEGVKLNTEQELLPGWMKEKDSLGSIFKDPLSKTVKNQAFRDLADAAAQMVQETVTYQPNKERHRMYIKNYERYVNLYRAVRPLVGGER